MSTPNNTRQPTARGTPCPAHLSAARERIAGWKPTQGDLDAISYLTDPAACLELLKGYDWSCGNSVDGGFYCEIVFPESVIGKTANTLCEAICRAVIAAHPKP
jgi:hypothetical protein